MSERADLSAVEAATVLRPGIRTYKPRRTRMSERQQRALRVHDHLRLAVQAGPIDLAAIWGAGVPVILDIGFGTGAACAQMAADEPGIGVLAIDVHTPGVGDLIDRLATEGATNVRVMEADALVVLERMIPPESLTGVRSYFPDPWPKARHHKRRLVQPAILDLVRSRLVPGGSWHLATDWQPYADSMAGSFAGARGWRGGTIPRPGWRPVTPYETRALREGRVVTDLMHVTEAL